MELEEAIERLRQEIQEKKSLLRQLEEELAQSKKQQECRKRYISSKEIVDFVAMRSGKTINMSTIKRWTDDGHLGDAIDEREHFWALKTKQGKKRNLYLRSVVFPFLYERGYIEPLYDILDEVCYIPQNLRGVIMECDILEGEFVYKLQLPDLSSLEHIPERLLSNGENNGCNRNQKHE
ncbi:hypothetical protein [Aneurinibacillus terranovensis]|uniref:hypothetical protein n=1 Tax=Aneurinibacillus terranovensis TaxID=278991 RepID=UPI00042188DD|nr:hypothetical protein [Aneurinibacillus terranovensis]